MATGQTPKPRPRRRAGRYHYALSAFAPVFLFVVGCSLHACEGQRTVNNDGGALDSAQPATCGFGVHVPEFDHQCKGGTGCRYMSTPPTCGCGCAACDGEICVRTQCGMNCPDGGPFDAGTDAVPDTGGDGTGPTDAGERDGSLYDVHEVTDTGTPTAGLGPEYRFVAEKVGSPQMYGDTIAWFTDYKHRTDRGEVGNDVCYLSLATGKTTCLGFNQNMFQTLRISVFGDRIAWSYQDISRPNYPYHGIEYFDIGAEAATTVEYGEMLHIGVPTLSDDNIVYYKNTRTSPSERKLFSYSLANKEISAIPTTGFPSELYLFGNDLVYYGGTSEMSDDFLVYHTVLGTGTNRLLSIPNTFKYFCCGMWGKQFVYQDWQGKYGEGPDVAPA